MWIKKKVKIICLFFYTYLCLIASNLMLTHLNYSFILDLDLNWALSNYLVLFEWSNEKFFRGFILSLLLELISNLNEEKISYIMNLNC